MICESTIWERSSTPENWALKEGMMCPEFLHLEDELSQRLDIGQLYNVAGEIAQGNDVLGVMRDFYVNLYSNKDHVSTKDIQIFLDKLDIPKLKSLVEDTEVTEQEVLNAIGKLKIGKTPGTDGLTAAFYKKFATSLVPQLVSCFNKAFITGSLTAMQKIAILVLLFKKGDPLDVGNYRPISLTNVDYKILAYILLACFQPFLDEIVHPAQTAYIPGKYIGINICKIQDVIDYAATNESEIAVLFLDFRKAFDSVSHIFLWSLMARMKFSPKFVQWVMLLYAQAESTVRNHG